MTNSILPLPGETAVGCCWTAFFWWRDSPQPLLRPRMAQSASSLQCSDASPIGVEADRPDRLEVTIGQSGRVRLSHQVTNVGP
jgi:hypothetical protein